MKMQNAVSSRNTPAKHVKKRAGDGGVVRKGTAKKVVKAADLLPDAPLDPDAVVQTSLRIPQPLYMRLWNMSHATREPMTEITLRGLEAIVKKEGY